MPDGTDSLDAIVRQFNSLAGAALSKGGALRGRQGPEAEAEFAATLDTLTGSMGELREAVGETSDGMELLADRMEPEGGGEGAPVPGERPEDAMGSIRGLLDKADTEGPGRAVGDIGDRRMVVMPGGGNTQLDILGVLKDIALIGLPFRGIATKAIGSKL